MNHTGAALTPTKRKMMATLLCLTILGGISVLLLPARALPFGGIWLTRAPMPTARSDLRAEAISGILYAAGGYSPESSTGDLATLEAYNPLTNSWASKAPMPVTDYGNPGRYGGASGVIDGQLYMAGGWRTNPPLPTSTLLVYDPTTDSWSSRASMPILSGCSGGAVIERKLYVVTYCDGYSGYRSYLHVYDPDTDSWSTLTGSPTIHVAPGAAALGGKFYVVGGFDGSSVTAIVDVYDPETNSWSTAASMPTARSALAARAVGDKLYAVGGHDGTAPVDTVEVYDPASDSWRTGHSMPTARYSLAAAVIRRGLFAVGGYDGTAVVPTLEVLIAIR